VRKLFTFVFSVLALAAPLSPANGGIVTWSFEAQVGLTSSAAGLNVGPLSSGIANGDTVTGTMSFDTDAIFGPQNTFTRTDFINAGYTPGVEFYEFMNEISNFSSALTFGLNSIMEVSFTVQTTGGSIALSSLVGSDVYDQIKVTENEYLPLIDGPGTAFDSVRWLTADQVTGETIGMRLGSAVSPSGLFPLNPLSSSPPSLLDLPLARVFHTSDQGEQFFAYLSRLELVEDVPAPAALGFLGLGLAGLGVARRRRSA